MENREQQILSEIKAMMGTIRSQLELLDAKMAELQQCVDPQEFEANPIELDIDDDLPFDGIPSPVVESPEVVKESPVFEPKPIEEPVVEQEPITEPEPIAPVEPEPAPEPETAVVSEQIQIPVAEDEDDDDLPGVFDQNVPLYAAAQVAPKVAPSVVEVMAETHPWRTDMPGSPVKDVRSAISLNDRIIFINHLFNEDPIIFQETITRINTMTVLDQVVDMLKGEHPEWDFNSELVYRFMMAVRRRIK